MRPYKLGSYYTHSELGLVKIVDVNYDSWDEECTYYVSPVLCSTFNYNDLYLEESKTVHIGDWIWSSHCSLIKAKKEVISHLKRRILLRKCKTLWNESKYIQKRPQFKY